MKQNSGRVLFIYIAKHHEINFGIAFLSAALKDHGWEPVLLVWHIWNDFQQIHEIDTLDDILASIGKEKPLCICLSVLTLHLKHIEKLLGRIDEVYDGPVIIGGYHAIIAPEDFLSHPRVTAVCIGDGELPLLRFLETYTKGEDCYGIPGLWAKKGACFSSDWFGEHWHVEHLDDFPYGDYELFEQTTALEKQQAHLMFSPSEQTLSVLPALSGRGCPFQCTYCNNVTRLKKFPSAHQYLRKYHPEKFVEILEQIVAEHHIDFIEFCDENFIYNPSWINVFAEEYGKKIRLPFSAMINLWYLDEAVCRTLADCGWVLSYFGIECGDELYRKTYLNRHISNATIEEKITLLKKYKIKMVTYNMIGMPFETAQTLQATLDLNRKIQPDLCMHFFWQPLPKTELTKIARDNGWLSENEDYVTNYLSSSFLKHDHPLGKELQHIHAVFSEEPFSMYQGAPDRLMKDLTEYTLRWRQNHHPLKYEQ